MIPLRSEIKRGSFPLVNILLVIANIVVFVHQLSLSPRAGELFVQQFGLVPLRAERALAHPGPQLGPALVPLVTSMFLHGGVLHILGNMLFLWVFGGNVEDRLGHLKYLGFYFICGIGAGLAQVLVNWGSRLPSVGASGAISGVMGAYIVLFPGGRILMTAHHKLGRGAHGISVVVPTKARHALTQQVHGAVPSARPVRLPKVAVASRPPFATAAWCPTHPR